MVSTLGHHKWWVRFGITNGEYALILQIVRVLWYYNWWSCVDSANCDNALVLQTMSTLWYDKWSVRYDIPDRQYALTIQMVSELRFEITHGEYAIILQNCEDAWIIQMVRRFDSTIIVYALMLQMSRLFDNTMASRLWHDFHKQWVRFDLTNG